jgi:hypothetical protein
MFVHDQIVSLSGKTNKGKQKVKHFGTLWRVVAVQEIVQFTHVRGPWVHVHSTKQFNEDGETISMDTRWVHATNDLDFEIRP